MQYVQQSNPNPNPSPSPNPNPNPNPNPHPHPHPNPNPNQVWRHSRFYNTADRLTGLLRKVSNEIINRCRASISISQVHIVTREQ